MNNYPPINHQLIDGLKWMITEKGIGIWSDIQLRNVLYDCYNFNSDIKLKQACTYCVKEGYTAHIVKLDKKHVGKYIRGIIAKESVNNNDLINYIIIFLFSVAVSVGKCSISEYPDILEGSKKDKKIKFNVIAFLKNLKFNYSGFKKPSTKKGRKNKNGYSIGKLDIFLMLYILLGFSGLFYGIAIEYFNAFQSSFNYFLMNLFVIVPQVTWLSLYAIFFKSSNKYWHKASHVTVRSIYILFTILFIIIECIPLLSIFPNISIWMYEHIDLHSACHLYSVPEHYKELYDTTDKFIHGINWFTIIIVTGGSIVILFKTHNNNLRKLDGYTCYKKKPQISLPVILWLLLGITTSYIVVLLLLDSKYIMFNKAEHEIESNLVNPIALDDPSFKNWQLNAFYRQNDIDNDVYLLQNTNYAIVINDSAMIENAIVSSSGNNTNVNDSLSYLANGKLYKYKTSLDNDDVEVNVFCYSNDVIGAIVIKPYEKGSSSSRFIKFKNYQSLLDLYIEKYKTPVVKKDVVLINNDGSSRDAIMNRTTSNWEYNNSRLVVTNKYILYVSDNFINSLYRGFKDHELYIKQENIRITKQKQREAFINDSIIREEQKKDSIQKIKARQKSKIDI